MKPKEYKKKQYHVVSAQSPDREHPERYIPTCSESTMCMSLDVSQYDRGYEEAEKLEKTLDEVLYEGQPTLFPLMVFGLDRLGEYSMKEVARRIHKWIESLDEKPEVIIIIKGSSYSLNIEEEMGIIPCLRDHYDADLTDEPAINSEAMRDLENGKFVPCRLKPRVLEEMQAASASPHCNDFLCINASVDDNLAVILPRSELTDDGGEVVCHKRADCFTVKITELMF